MAATGPAERARPSSALARLLHEPRYEIIPVKGVEEKAGVLPRGTIVTVTASPHHGIERTIEVSEALTARGHRVVTHLAARMVRDRRHLDTLVRRLEAAGVREAFVIGGDASPPAGRYAAAVELLEDLATLEHPFGRIGIGGYPEGHPLISDEALLDALRRKQPYADVIVTQLCFDAAALDRWLRTLRGAGIGLDVVVGLPGVVERRRLAEISLKTGVGASLRYLRKHGRELALLSRSRRYDPTPLARSISVGLDDPASGVVGAHLFTFNQVEATWEWARRAAAQ
jgi:methylenetetrahydrofolate reductase (NADPH)